MSDLVGARVVAVHAHPDDEAITTGGTIATLSERGAEVTVVTCTLGEQGEVIGAPYQGLVRSDQLGGFRIAELEAALAHLGVRHGEFLGGVARWRDSGMQGDPANDHPNAFIHSGDTAVQQLAEVFDRVRPQLVITYGPESVLIWEKCPNLVFSSDFGQTFNDGPEQWLAIVSKLAMEANLDEDQVIKAIRDTPLRLIS